MDLAIIDVFRTKAEARILAPITAGLVGATVDVRCDSSWKDYELTFVWVGNGRCIKDKTASAVIPYEVVEKEGGVLKFGVSGKKGDVEISTIWVNLGLIYPSADPSESSTPGPGDSIIVDDEGYITTVSGGFTADEDGYILL